MTDRKHEVMGLDAFFVDEEEQQIVAASYSSALDNASLARGETAELLAFRVADEEYAIEIGRIQEIIKVPAITSVPRLPGAIRGIISLRGTIVPILDLKSLLFGALSDFERATRVLVLHGEGDPLGVVVDAVTSVHRFGRDDIEAVPKTMHKQTSDLLRGVARVDGRLLIEVEVEHLFEFMEAVDG